MKARAGRPAVLAGVLLAFLGLRLLAGRAIGPNLDPRDLRIPFDRFPMEVLGPEWKGADVATTCKSIADKLNSLLDDAKKKYTK